MSLTILCISFGGFLSLIMAFGHVLKKHTTPMDKYASGALLTLSIGLINFALYETQFYGNNPLLFGYLVILTIPYGLFAADFFRSLKSQPSLGIKHYLPFCLIFLLLFAPIVFQDSSFKKALLNHAESDFGSYRSYYRFVVSLLYLVTLGYMLQPLKSIIFDWPKAYRDAPYRKIILTSVGVYSIATLLLLLLSIINSSASVTSNTVAGITLFLVVLFWINLRYPEFYQALNEEVKTAEKYGDLFKNIDKQELLERFNKLLETEQLFLKGNISLDTIAKKLSISRNLLSALINDTFDANLNTVINSFRVKYAKDLLVNNQTDSIIDICYSSGFNSKSIFYKAFREHAGMTPAEFRALNASKDQL